MEESGSPVSHHSPASSDTENLIGETLAPEMDNEADQNPEQNGAAGDGGSVLSGRSPPAVEMKRKRGRPRKYEVIGGVPSSPVPVSMVSSSLSSSSSMKRGRGRPRGSGRLQLLASVGGIVVDTAGGSFTPHVIIVQTGEDVVGKIISFSEKGPRAVCVISATGVVSNVTIRQPSGGFLRFEGLFEILNLSGSHVFNSTSGPQQRQNGMLSVSLAKPDGRVFGGGVVGSMIAAGPIQIVVGSFKQDISSQLRRLSAESAVANALASPDLVRVPVMMAPTNVDERNLTSAFLESAHGGEAGNSIAANQHMSHTSLLNLGQNAFQAMSDQRTPPDSKSNFVHL